MSGNSKRENREIPAVSQLTFDWERPANVSDGTAGMHAAGKSDGSVVPAKSANNDAAEALAESMEERDPAERNAGQDDPRRTPSRVKRRSIGLIGVRAAARKDRTLKFVNLLHHVDVERLREGFRPNRGCQVLTQRPLRSIPITIVDAAGAVGNDR
jgi:hypothetical protein